MRVHRLTDSRGDTIIEVLIVLTILGLAMGISYATANRSLLNTRQAQESSRATVLLQSQIEALRTLAPAGSSAPAASNIFVPAGELFCINLDNTVKTFPAGNLDDPATYPAECTRDSIPIRMSISYAADSGSVPGGTFNLTAKWDDVHGDGQDSATLVYRLFP